MAKQYKIRWKQSDIEELRRVVSNFNKKLKRLQSKGEYAKVTLPEKASVKELKSLINTRSDLRRELNKLRRFSRRNAEEIEKIPGNENNVRITKWQRKEMNREVAIVNRKRKKRLEQLKQLEMKSSGESLGYTKAEIGMGSPEMNELRPTKAFTRTMGPKDILIKAKTLRTQTMSDYFNKRDYLVKENYLKGLRQNFNESDVKDVIIAIEIMPIDKFMRVFNEEGSTFEMLYPVFQGGANTGYVDTTYSDYVNSLRKTWLGEEDISFEDIFDEEMVE